MKFSEEVKKAFFSAGWKKGRRIKELNLPYDDYPEKAKAFLGEYGRLIVQCKQLSLTTVITSCIIDPEVDPNRLSEDDTFSYYSELLGQKLFPLAALDSGNGYEVCCDEDGRVYKIGEYCFHVGSSIEEGFENIIAQNSRKSLQLNEDTGEWWNMEGEIVELPK